MSERAEASDAAFWGDTAGSEVLERYRTLVNAIDDGIYQLDAERRFVAVDDVLVELTGYAPEALLGEHVSALFGDDGGAAIERELDRLRGTSGGRGKLLDLTARTAEGAAVYCEVRPSELEGEGDARGSVGVVRETADRTRRTRERRRVVQALEAAREGISLLDDDGSFIYVNDAYADTFGYDPEEMIDRHWEDLGIEANPDKFNDEVLPNLSEEGQWTGTTTCVRSDDSTFRAQHTLTQTEADELICVVRDVSDWEDQKRKIEENERRYRTLVENFPNGAVALFDETLEYTIAGGEVLDEIGATEEEIVGQSIWERYPEELAAKFERNFRAAIEDGESNEFEVEFHDRHWRSYTLPVRDDEGDIFAGMLMSQDVTERKKREQALRESKKQLRALIDLLPVAVFVAEADGQIVEWNDAAEEVWGGEVAESQSVAEYAEYDGWWVDTGEQVEPHEWALARALRGEEVTDPDEIEIEGFDGERRTVLNHGMPIRDADGEVSRAVVTLVDITERKEYQRELEKSNERLEQFAHAASHDLQEPLRMVSSYLQLIDQRYADELDEDGEEFIEFAVDGADRMRDMIDGLLKYSRVETRGNDFEPVELDDVLEEVRDDLQVAIEESDARITADSLPRVQGDASQLRQVFQNLLDNAIEYSGDDPPRVRVGAERDGDEWEISVSDEGIGIGPDEADRVFEVFRSLHANDDHPGTGIGLALCERIVERHGGEIWVETEPGEGSTFTFTLPVRD